MSNINWNFVDNLSIPSGKYLKWLDLTGITRHNILGVDTFSNTYLNSGQGDMYINNNNTNSNTFFNINNNGNSFFNTKVGIGFNSTSNMSSNLTLPIFGWIGLNSTQGSNSGYLGLAASSSLLNTSGSKILLYGNDATGGNAGGINIYTGNTLNGNIQMYTGNNNQVVQILNNGTTNFSPDGSDITISITSNGNTITTPINISSTIESNSSTSGALVIAGGVGISGNINITGTLSINSILGNLNFNNTTISTSYSTGTFFLSGGIGVECSAPATSITSGGAISIAGGMALGGNAFIGGNVTIINTNVSNSAVSGSGIFYGGVGINGQTNIRSDQMSQIRIIPFTSGNETSILFGNTNNYTTTGSWCVGQNVNLIGSGNFGINSKDNGTYITLNNSSQIIYLNKYTSLLNTLNINNNSISDLITFNDTQGNNMWSIGRVISDTTGNFQISRFSQGNFINNLLTSDVKTGNINIIGTENSLNSNSGGALTVNGGASISKDIYIGGNMHSSNINFTGNLVSQSTTDSNTLSYLTLTGTGGSLITFGGINIQSTLDTTSSTNGGSLTVLGGGSINKSLIVGNTITSSVVSSINGVIINSTMSNIYSINSNNINMTNSNLSSTNITVSNLSNTNSSIVNANISNSSFGNIISNIANILQLSTVNISSNNGYIINITSNNILSANISSSNANINNLRNNLSIVNNLTVGTILVSDVSNLNGNSNTIGNIYTTGGNVGINNTTPKQLLDINGNLAVNGGLYMGDPLSGNARVNIKDINNNLICFYNINSTVGSITTNGQNMGLYFNVGNTNQLSITSSGNVGINASNPMYSLDIKGTLRTQDTNWVSDTVNNMTNTIGSNNFSSDIVFSNTTRNSLIFNNVGISEPTFNKRSIGSKLIIYPNISSTSFDYAIGVGDNSLWFSNPGTNGYKWYLSSTSSNMTLNNNGLGINNNNPSYTLDVNGVGRFVNSVIGQFNSNTIGNLYTTGGNIGINQVSPQFTLDVSGTGRFTGNLDAIYNSNTLGNIYTTGGNIGVNNTSPNQMVEISPITYNANLSGGLRVSTTGVVNKSDVSYRYMDLRLSSDNMSNFRGSIYGTLTGGVLSEYEYMSFNQVGTISVYPQTIFYNSTNSSSVNVGSVVMNGGLSISNNLNAFGVGNGGALTVNGGAAFGEDVYIGGNLTVYGNINTGMASSTFAYLRLTATDNSVNITSGALISSGGISIKASFNATSTTSGGGLTVVGGIATSRDVYIGGTMYGNSNSVSSTVSTLLVTNNIKCIFNSNTLGNIYTTGGNVGINCTRPRFPLTIGNSDGASAESGGTIFVQASMNPSLGFGAGGNSYMWISAPLQTTGGLLSLGANGTSAATSGGVINISSNAYVGINNTDPAYSLDVSGVLNIRTSNDSINFTNASLICYGGISIAKTSNSSSTTCGGALTIAGGLSVFKDVYVGGTVTSSSDIRLKKNIRPISDILDKIDSIRTVRYNTLVDTDNRDYIGFLAQDFEETFPELLSKSEKDSNYSLGYDRMTVINLKCIKELKMENINLRKRLESIENEIQKLLK